MLGRNKSATLNRQRVRLLAKIRFLDRSNAKNAAFLFYANKMLVYVSDLADVEYQLNTLEQK